MTNLLDICLLIFHLLVIFAAHAVALQLFMEGQYLESAAWLAIGTWYRSFDFRMN